MKKFGVFALWLVILSWVIVWCSSKQADEDQVIVYNGNIISLWEKCIEAGESMWNIYNWYSKWSTEDVKSAIDDAVSQCKDSMFQINDLWGMDWDDSLKDGVIVLIQKMLEQYEKLYEILPFLPLLDEGLVEEDLRTYEQIVEDLDSLGVEIQDLNKNLVEIQRWFAERYWYEVDD